MESVEYARLGEYVGKTVRLCGAVHKIRRMGRFAFVLLRGAREILQCVYEPRNASFVLEALREEMCVCVTGNVRADERSRAGFEVVLTAVEILSRPAEAMPIAVNGTEMEATLDDLLAERPLTLRHPAQRAIFKVQEGIARSFREYCQTAGLTEIHTPKLSQAGAEGGEDVFSLDYFGKTAYLAQSPQLYKQMMVGVFERVYEVGPVFRAEKHDTARHLSEYTSMDCEIGYVTQLEELLDFERGWLRYMWGCLAETCAPELEMLGAVLPNTLHIPSMDFTQAKELIRDQLGFAGEDGQDFEPEEERLLGEYARREMNAEFLFITGYPSAKRPFYAMDDPGGAGKTLSFGLLLRGQGISTGGLRCHDYAAQAEKMRARGMEAEDFAFYLTLHRHGVPPHGGMGIGLERVTARVLGLDDVRRAALFPRDAKRLAP